LDPLRIVVIGGGSGLSSLLRGLKKHVHFPGAPPALTPYIDVTAVVTVTDDGGSSGRLRREMEIPPPGDIRNCMVALSEDEALLSRLFQYRFAAGRGLKGHSFGNLFLTALTHLTGDFATAIQMSSDVLASRGRIFPSTAANVTLEAVLESGELVAGETRISRSRSPIKEILLRPRRCDPLPETLRALDQADLICLGPGSLFTSVIPNLLVDGIPQAIARSRAMKTYFTNLMWQPGETMNYAASDHLKAVYDHSRPDLVESIVVNTRPIAGKMRRRYAAQQVFPVKVDHHHLEEMGLRIVGGNLLDHGEKVRHSPQASAAIAVSLAAEARVRRRRLRPSGRNG
jgi:uncharacterized cofD-like protein